MALLLPARWHKAHDRTRAVPERRVRPGRAEVVVVSEWMSRAQEDALGRLVDQGTLSADQLAAVRAALESTPPRRGPAGWLVEIAGYVGGGLILGAVALFVGESWASMSRPTRTALLAGFALVFALAGLLVAGGPRAVGGLARGPAGARDGIAGAGGLVRRRIAAVLFALAAVPAALAAGIAVDRYPVLTGTLVGLAVAVAGWALLPAVPGVLMTAAMSVAAISGLIEEVLRPSPLTVGLLILALGLAWIAISVVGLVRPRWLGLAIGAGMALLGAQQPLGDPNPWWAYGLTAAVAIASFALYRWQRELVLLIAGVVGMTLAVPEAVSDLTNGALGGAAILLVAGAVLVAASAVGLRIRHTRPELSPPPAPVAR